MDQERHCGATITPKLQTHAMLCICVTLAKIKRSGADQSPQYRLKAQFPQARRKDAKSLGVRQGLAVRS
jgi:hypothetical protein